MSIKSIEIRERVWYNLSGITFTTKGECRMKLGIFTDSHYSSRELTCSVRRNSLAFGRIKKAMEHFTKEKCDLAICLGDLTDFEETYAAEEANLRKIAKLFDEFRLSVVVVMGNHDGFSFEKDTFYEILGRERSPRTIKLCGNTLLFPDTCFFDSGEHYKSGDEDWTNSYLPDTEALHSELNFADGDTYVFMHHNIDPDIREDHRVRNSDEIRRILKDSGKVRAVYQGHYHPGYESVHDGIEYVTFPALCENEDAYFVIEL